MALKLKPLLAFALLAFAVSLPAATNTVYFDLGIYTSSGVAYKQVRIAPSKTSFPRAEGNQVTGIDYGFLTTDATGKATNVMVSGTYDITFTNRFLATTFQITVPSTNASGILSAAELTTSGTNSPSNLAAYSITASDARYPSAFGSNVVSWTSNGVRWIASAAGGSGGSATNAVATIRTNSAAVASGATSITFTNGTNIQVAGVDIGSGEVKITINSTLNTNTIQNAASNAVMAVHGPQIAGNSNAINTAAGRLDTLDGYVQWDGSDSALSLSNTIGGSGIRLGASVASMGVTLTLPAVQLPSGDVATRLAAAESTNAALRAATNSFLTTNKVTGSAVTQNGDGTMTINSTGGGSATNLTPWTSNINGAGFQLANAGNITSTGTVAAASFAGSGSGAGSLTLDGANSGRTILSQADSAATNTITLSPGAPSSGQVLKYDSASGTWTNAADNNSGGSSAFNSSNIIISTTANTLIDLANFDRFTIKLLTNATITFTNTASLTRRARVVFQQDTNGQRAVTFANAGGLLQTNASLVVTTNANAVDLLEAEPGLFNTNLFVWWPQNFQPRIAFTNSLAAGTSQTNALTPTFSPNGGLTSTNGGTNVVITSAGPAPVNIYWTTNGDTPTTNLTAWVSPATVTNMPSGVLKAIAWTNSGFVTPSSVASATFTNEASGGSCPADGSPNIANTGSTSFLNFNSDAPYVGQIYQTNVSWTLCKARFTLTGQRATNIFTARVYALSAGTITPGSPLAISDPVTSSQFWVVTNIFFTFSSPATLSANTDYAVVVTADDAGNSLNSGTVYYSATDTMPGNAAAWFSNGTKYDPGTGHDLSIALYWY